MKKIQIFFLLIVLALFGCKKSEDVDPSSSSSGAPVDITIKTYVGYHGYKMAFDTTSGGIHYDTLYYSVPQIAMILDNSSVEVYKDGTLINTGNTDANGEYKIQGISGDGKYSYKVKSKTLQSQNGYIYHYSANHEITYITASVVDHFDIAFRPGIGQTDGVGSTPTPIQEPYF